VDPAASATTRSNGDSGLAVTRNGGGSAARKANPTSVGMVTRSMPQSIGAEASVLGSMIVDPRCIADVIEVVSRNAFYHTEHQMIFDAVIGLYEKNRGEGIDGFLVRDELEKRGQIESIGGLESLQRVIETVPSSANARYYADIVRQKELLRELIVVANEILTDAYDESGDASEKVDEAERKIFKIAEKRITGSIIAVRDLLSDVYAAIERRKDKHLTGLATGFEALNQLTCGLQKGEMIIIAGRPSMGKTAIALNIAEHICVEENVALAVFSLEMSAQQLAERLLCSRAHVDAQQVRRGILRDEDYGKLVDACGAFSNANMFIDDTSLLTPLELRAKARRLKSKHNIQCIMVDYLQMMQLHTSKVESRQQEITTISRNLKSLARELDVPVVVLSQLNRASEGREDHRPRLSDLRESGSIEQDADVVMLLHREDYYHRGQEDYEPNNTAEVIVAKQRNGPTDTVKLTFLERYTRFENQTTGFAKDVPF
jgi:replicative DNA helicase